ncbi:MAG: GNAT family N-acetyltransferase [Ardenticatenales bacterium]|nr:GNAT family N-acetyltransferase [Ardenticatenales bacterium]
MSIQIHPLMPQDQPEVLAVARTLAAWFRPLDQMALAIDLREQEGLVALENNQVVGFLTHHMVGERAELSWLGVLPEKQDRGIGSLLLATLEQLLLERSVLWLQLSTVPADHDVTFVGTNAFYQRHGFTVRQRDDNFYAHGRPRILLEKMLSPP